MHAKTQSLRTRFTLQSYVQDPRQSRERACNSAQEGIFESPGLPPHRNPQPARREGRALNARVSHKVEKGRALFEGIAPVGSRFSPAICMRIYAFRMGLRAMGNPTVRSRASPAATCQLALEARKLIKLVLGLVVRRAPGTCAACIVHVDFGSM